MFAFEKNIQFQCLQKKNDKNSKSLGIQKQFAWREETQYCSYLLRNMEYIQQCCVQLSSCITFSCIRSLLSLLLDNRKWRINTLETLPDFIGTTIQRHVKFVHNKQFKHKMSLDMVIWITVSRS